MPPIDISSIFRLLPSFLQENSEIREQGLLLARIADGNPQAEAEDRELNADEIRTYVESTQQAAQALNRDLATLRSQRLNLLGSVENARQLLGGLGVGETVLGQVGMVAAAEGTADQLELLEIERWIRSLEQVTAGAAALNALTLEGDAQRFVQELGEMERNHPERFLPLSPEAQKGGREPQRFALARSRGLEPDPQPCGAARG